MTLDDMETSRDRDGFIVLKRTYSELYKKTNYTTPLTYIQNTIYEYDIKAANLTMLRESGKVDGSTLDMLESLDKQAREVAVGKIIRRQPKVYDIITKGIRRARERLFRENGIQDHEVLSIKNDAVFIIGRRLQHTTFGEVEFRMKNRYALFQRIDKLEFFYDKRNDVVDIKGVKDKILKHPDHQSGMLTFFSQVFRYLCYDRKDDLRAYLIQFAREYKNKKLPHQYYRELNSENIYRTHIELSGFGFNLEDIGNSDLSFINPIYNYKRFILPMIWCYI